MTTVDVLLARTIELLGGDAGFLVVLNHDGGGTDVVTSFAMAENEDPLAFVAICQSELGRAAVVLAEREQTPIEERRANNRDVPEAVLGADFEPDSTGHPR